MQLILASASPRRRNLLQEMGVSFIVSAADVDEWEDVDADPEELVLFNARLKGRTVSKAHPESAVLSSDTTVCLDDRIFNKPKDMEEARSMLSQLAGRTHVVFTAVCLISIEAGIEESICVRSEVTFKELDAAAIDSYFKIVNPLDKAGAYGIQEGREKIIETFKGSLSNIMGLPVDETRVLLKKYSIG